MKNHLKLVSLVIITVVFISFNARSIYAQNIKTSISLTDNIKSDINKSVNNSSSSSVRAIKKLYLKAVFEGYYDYFTHTMNKTHDMNMNTGQIFPKFPGAIVDTATVTLAFYSIPLSGCDFHIYSNVTFDTTGVFAPITLNANDTNLSYIVISHRNHIETWSATKVSFIPDSVYYDFSPNVSKAFGNNQKQVAPNQAAIFSGDLGLYKDGVVNIFDLSDVFDAEMDPSGMYNGYVIEDLNGDGVVNIFDMAIIYDNLMLGVQTIGPTNC